MVVHFSKSYTNRCDIFTFAGVFAIAIFSSSLAARVQYFVLAVTALSIACVAFGPWNSDPTPIRWWGGFEGTGGGYIGFGRPLPFSFRRLLV